MALTVGELNAIVSIDDGAVDPALRRVENAMRETGEQVGDDAERAGQQAGEQLGEGVVRGADGRLRNLQGRFVAATRQAGDDATQAARQAGQDAGDALGDGMGETAGQGADQAVGQASQRLEKLKMAGAAIGALAGAALMTAMADAMDQSRITGRLGAQLGKTPAEAQRYGKIAGKLYAGAITEDFQTAADAIRVTMASGLLPTNATDKQIQSLATKVHDLASTFELDLGQTANAIGQMLKTGLAKDGAEAIDIVSKGVSGLGPRADDVADTFNEYSTIFRAMGLDGKTAMGLIRQGMLAGARDTDIVADSVKEFTIEAVAGGDRVRQGFKSLKLDADDMVARFAKGGPTAAKAFDTVLDKLRAIKDPAERNATAIELFGTKAEDMGDALFALDPSKAVSDLGKVGGAANKMGDALRENSGTTVEQFKRGIQQGLVDFLGGTVIPGVQRAGGVFKRTFGSIWADAGNGDAADKIINVFGSLGSRIGQKIAAQAPHVVSGLMSLGGKAADYIVANPEKVLKLGLITAAIITGIVALPLLVGAALSAAVAMMMIGFGKSLVTGVTENLPQWWDAFTNWVSGKATQTGQVFDVVGSAVGGWFGGLWSRYISGPVSRQWDSWTGSVRTLPGRSVSALSALGGNLASTASSAWQRFKDGSTRKGSEFLSYVGGLPGRTVSAIGDLGSLLVGKGMDVVRGLWAGISSMTGWLKGQISSWAKSAVPGPIADALGISSPSKVTKAQGRWIARGLVEGMTGSEKQVKAASAKLADIIADSLKPGSRRSRALATLSSGTKQLLTLARQEEQLAARLKKATAKLNEQTKARDQLAASIKQGIVSSADITQGSGPMTAEGILARLDRDRKHAEAFTKNLAKLQKAGVRSDLISQIAQAGVDQGSATAAALAQATPGQIKKINAEQAALVKVAGKAGSTAADAMYGAGIAAGQGLVKGLQKQQKAIEAQMLRIARSMSKAIRKELGIKSPSRVMARIGEFIPKGLVRGIDSGRRAVDRSMTSLVSTPTPGQLAVSAARTAAGGPSRVTTTNNTYSFTARPMTMQEFEGFERRRDALARVGRPR
ncbi:phage tail tape measure protein [Streptomyces brasiliscabiei]|uniref:phage tail tape measure protein n=1 Tax=Streptomyces brasiliscabiei TaxID=2736302 RepID=UPI001C103BA9|nr:phage tail tape measure protein [Streptomyces brasiliscabiei]